MCQAEARILLWIDNIPTIVARCEWDPQSVARNLITTLPAPLRVRCPGYSGMEDGDAFSAAAVAGNIRDEVKMAQRCDDLDAKKIGRVALEAIGDTGARNLRLFRPSND